MGFEGRRADLGIWAGKGLGKRGRWVNIGGGRRLFSVNDNRKGIGLLSHDWDETVEKCCGKVGKRWGFAGWWGCGKVEGLSGYWEGGFEAYLG